MGTPATLRWGPGIGAAALALLLGCRTPSESALPAPVGADWHVQQGQAVWCPGRGRPELAGEVLVASASGDRWLAELTKTPMSLVVASRSAGRWTIQFPGAGRRYSGRGDPPTRFLWCYLRPALAGETLPGRLRFEQKPEGRWRLANPATGETLEGFLEP